MSDKMSDKLSYEELEIKYEQARGALGYPVPGHIPESDLKCGICEKNRLDQFKTKVENNTLKQVLEIIFSKD